MGKVLVSLDERLLKRIDGRARRRGLTRSAYLAQLAEQDLAQDEGPGADPRVHEAVRELQLLFARNPRPGDSTELIRQQRDSR